MANSQEGIITINLPPDDQGQDNAFLIPGQYNFVEVEFLMPANSTNSITRLHLKSSKGTVVRIRPKAAVCIEDSQVTVSITQDGSAVFHYKTYNAQPY
jgi:hypothetical protein